WERHILPARVAAYKGSWLDELCFSGDITWARLNVPKANGSARPEGNGSASAKGAAGRLVGRPRMTQANSATPISLARRADLPWLLARIRPASSIFHRPSSSNDRGSGFNLPGNGEAQPSTAMPAAGAAREIFDLLASRGALFYDDIVSAT